MCRNAETEKALLCQNGVVGKRDVTHQRLLKQGLELVSEQGFDSVTIGELGKRTELSKSGVFAHFGSVEALHLALLQAANELARLEVVTPAMQAPPGLPRLRRLFDRWLGWAARSGLPGGCPFVAATAEFSEAEGEVRDYLGESVRGLVGIFQTCINEAIVEGQLSEGVDAKALAWQIFGLYNAHHVMQRLMRDADADAVALQGLEKLLTTAQL